MSLFILDTDHLTMLRQAHLAVVTRAVLVPRDELASTVITFEEQVSGWYTAVRKARDAEKFGLRLRRPSRGCSNRAGHPHPAVFSRSRGVVPRLEAAAPPSRQDGSRNCCHHLAQQSHAGHSQPTRLRADCWPEVQWRSGNHPDYENYAPVERIPLKQFFKGAPKAARETLRTIKLTPKKKVGATSPPKGLEFLTAYTAKFGALIE